MKVKNIDITNIYPYMLIELLKIIEKELYISRTKLPNDFILNFIRIRSNI